MAELAVTATVVEHDSGDIEAEKALISEALSDAATSAAAAYTGGAGALAKPLIDWVAAELVGIGARLLGVADDVFTPGAVPLRSDWLAAADTRRRTLRRKDDARTIDWTDVMVVIGRDDGGDVGEYALYFDVRPRQGVTPPRPQPGARQSVWQGQWELARAGSAASAVAASSRFPEQLDAFWVRPTVGRRHRPLVASARGRLAAAVGAGAGGIGGLGCCGEFAVSPNNWTCWVRPDGGVTVRSWLQQEGGWQQPWELAPADRRPRLLRRVRGSPNNWTRSGFGLTVASPSARGFRRGRLAAAVGAGAGGIGGLGCCGELRGSPTTRHVLGPADGAVSIRSWFSATRGTGPKPRTSRWEVNPDEPIGRA